MSHFMWFNLIASIQIVLKWRIWQSRSWFWKKPIPSRSSSRFKSMTPVWRVRAQLCARRSVRLWAAVSGCLTLCPLKEGRRDMCTVSHGECVYNRTFQRRIPMHRHLSWPPPAIPFHLKNTCGTSPPCRLLFQESSATPVTFLPSRLCSGLAPSVILSLASPGRAAVKCFKCDSYLPENVDEGLPSNQK